MNNEGCPHGASPAYPSPSADDRVCRPVGTKEPDLQGEESERERRVRRDRESRTAQGSASATRLCHQPWVGNEDPPPRRTPLLVPRPPRETGFGRDLRPSPAPPPARPDPSEEN